MQYTVVHSKDPYLLARLATDLQMEGYKSDLPWNDMYNCFNESVMWVAVTKSIFVFFDHKCIDPAIRHELTSRNYIKVLTQILEP